MFVPFQILPDNSLLSPSLQGFIRTNPICDAKFLRGFLHTKQLKIDTYRRRYGAPDITSEAQKRLSQWSWLPPWGFTCSACQARKSDVLPTELSCSRSGQQFHTDKDHQKTRKQLLAKQSSWASTIVNATKYTQWTSACLRSKCIRTFFQTSDLRSHKFHYADLLTFLQQWPQQQSVEDQKH